LKALNTTCCVEVLRARLWVSVFFAEDFSVGFSVGIETGGFAALPGGFVFGVGDVPVGAALFGDDTKILAEVFEGGAAPEPVAVVDLEDDEARLEHDGVGDHGIVNWVGVFGDVEVFLDAAACVGEEGPLGTDAAAEFVGLGDAVGADGDETGIGDFHLAMELEEEFGLAAVFGAEASAAEDEHHGMLPLQLGELAAGGGVVA